VAARRKAALLLHLPATGTGKAGDFATFLFTDSAIELESVLFQEGAALFRIWRGKGDI
jgi:hypothetical protein